jgi:hypothetical protein
VVPEDKFENVLLSVPFGGFELEAAMPETEGLIWVELRLHRSDRLSAADPRIASILLKSIELIESP